MNSSRRLLQLLISKWNMIGCANVFKIYIGKVLKRLWTNILASSCIFITVWKKCSLEGSLPSTSNSISGDQNESVKDCIEHIYNCSELQGQQPCSSPECRWWGPPSPPPCSVEDQSQASGLPSAVHPGQSPKGSSPAVGLLSPWLLRR